LSPLTAEVVSSHIPSTRCERRQRRVRSRPSLRYAGAGDECGSMLSDTSSRLVENDGASVSFASDAVRLERGRGAADGTPSAAADEAAQRSDAPNAASSGQRVEGGRRSAQCEQRGEEDKRWRPGSRLMAAPSPFMTSGSCGFCQGCMPPPLCVGEFSPLFPGGGAGGLSTCWPSGASAPGWRCATGLGPANPLPVSWPVGPWRFPPPPPWCGNHVGMPFCRPWPPPRWGAPCDASGNFYNVPFEVAQS
jgi:hypothetical protein